MSISDAITETAITVFDGRKSVVMVEFEKALARGDTEFCLNVLEQKPSFANKVEKDMFGRDTPLMAAIRAGNAPVCDKLLSLGAKMNVPHQYVGDNETPLSAVLRHYYQHSEVKDVLVKHYAERKQAEKDAPAGLLDRLKAKAGGLFKSISEKVDEIVKLPGVALGGISAVPAAIGLGIGAAPAVASMLATGAVVGSGIALASLVRQNSRSKLLLSHENAVEEFEYLAGRYVKPPDIERLQAGALLRDDNKIVEVSKLLADEFVAATGRESKPINYEQGRYSGMVVFQTERHVVQDLGRATAVVHGKDHLDVKSLQAAITKDQSLRIQYKDGRGNIDAGQTRGQDQGRSR